jgi:hypothetical protein
MSWSWIVASVLGGIVLLGIMYYFFIMLNFTFRG